MLPCVALTLNISVEDLPQSHEFVLRGNVCCSKLPAFRPHLPTRSKQRSKVKLIRTITGSRLKVRGSNALIGVHAMEYLHEKYDGERRKDERLSRQLAFYIKNVSYAKYCLRLACVYESASVS